MFSISSFMFGPTSVNEGGNTRALVRDPATGLVTGGEQVRTFRGREAYAEKIDLRSGRITRQQLRNDVIEMLTKLDEEFELDHGHPIWDRTQRNDILGSGFAFNGSSSHLFAPPETLSDEEFVKYKPSVGDIDLTVPADKMDELYQTLNRREDAQLTPKIAYIGHNKKTPGSHQINALFAYTWDPDAPEGEGDTFFQIDFEGSEYEGGRPTEWAKFSYSSSWRDVLAGVKGLAHKVLLFSIAAVKSPPPIGAREATPTASAESPTIKTTRNPSFVEPSPDEIERMVVARQEEIMVDQKRKNPESARKAAEREITSQIKKSSRMPAPLRPVRTLDLVTGLGDRYQRLDWTHNGDEVYKYLKRSERTNSIRDVKAIFDNLIGNNPPPTPEDLEKFGSFLGVIELMKERFAPQEIVKVYEEMVDRFFGDRGQQLSATDPSEDMGVKDKVLETFRQLLPEAESSTIDLEGIKSRFYSRYKTRGQEGFEEDSDQPGIDESRNRKLARLIEAVIWGS
jgi:hypothetical protein